MADNLPIGTGVSPGTATMAADEIGGVLHQRVKPVFGADGSATDVSPAAPLPTSDAAVRDRLPVDLTGGGLNVTPTGTVLVSGPLTDAQLRSAPVVVDTEFGGASSTGARVPLATSSAATTHVFDDPGSSAAAAPVRTARMVGDGEPGSSFPAAASMRWNGAAWSRSRTSTISPIALLSSGDRATTANGTFAYPSVATYDCPVLLMMLHVTGIGTGALQLVVKATGSNATLAALNVTPASVTGAAAGAPVDVCLLLGASAPYGGAITAGTTTTAALRYGVSAVPVPVPGQITGYTQHTDASTWTYSLDYHLIA